MDNDINDKLASLRETLETSLNEARSYKVGTIRLRKTGRYQKTNMGWIPIQASMKSIAARAAHTSAPQDIKHASVSSGKTPAYPSPSKGGRTKAEAIPTAKVKGGSTPSYSHQSKSSGHGAYALPTPSQSKPPPSKPGGVMGHGHAAEDRAKLGAFFKLAGLTDDRILEMKKVADMDEDEVVGCAQSLAAQATFARRGKRPMGLADAKRFKEAMGRIKDEGLMGDDDQDALMQKWKG